MFSDSYNGHLVMKFFVEQVTFDYLNYASSAIVFEFLQAHLPKRILMEETDDFFESHSTQALKPNSIRNIREIF